MNYWLRLISILQLQFPHRQMAFFFLRGKRRSAQNAFSQSYLPLKKHKILNVFFEDSILGIKEDANHYYKNSEYEFFFLIQKRPTF